MGPCRFCGRGGTGRRASLRSLWAKARGSSSLLDRTRQSAADTDPRLRAEHDGASGAVIREYIWLGDTVIAMVDGMASAPAYSFVHTGHLAEPLLVTDAAGAVVSSITRDPWGNAILLAGTAAIRLGYPGQWHDGTSGLYQNWHRDYDPTLGRYMETDPIGLAGGTNLYAYVDGNPVNAVDPMGLRQSAGGTIISFLCQIFPVYCALPAILPQIPEKKTSPNTCPARGLCPPCTPHPAATVGYIGPHYDHDHWPIGRPHLNLFQVNQDPVSCRCKWNKAKPSVAAPPPLPDWVDLNGGFPVLKP